MSIFRMTGRGAKTNIGVRRWWLERYSYLGILGKIEALLKERQGDEENFRLCHYFDMIAGTSTGSIIAAALAIGMKVQEITEMYLELGQRVFEKSYFRQGFLRALYDKKALIAELKKVDHRVFVWVISGHFRGQAACT